MKSQNLTDSQLVQLYLSGDEAAFEVLLRRNQSQLYGYILKIVKDPELAEDFFQDTFMKAIRSMQAGVYNDENKFSAWLFRIAHNLAIDHFRRLKKFRTVSADNEETDYLNSEKLATPATDISIAEMQVLEDLKDLIELLPEDQRSVVKMRVNLKMSFKEIADFYGISINTALGRMRYALINIRKEMKSRNMSLVAE
jgi:RNA polymerase sigma factor (sigma-70 family)